MVLWWKWMEMGMQSGRFKEAPTVSEITNDYTSKKIETITDTEVKKLPIWSPPPATVDYIPPSAPKEINEKCLKWEMPRNGGTAVRCVKFK